MKEHGLLFSTPMAQALDAGRKFRTMRAITRRNSLLVDHTLGETRMPTVDEWDQAVWERAYEEGKQLCGAWDCGWTLIPRIRPGDVIWSKETHALVDPGIVLYRARDVGDRPPARWTSSMLQHRKDARFLLPVVRTSVQRPRELTCEEISREGIDVPQGWLQSITAWRELWTEINGDESWKGNDPHWVYEWREIRRGP